MKKTVKRRGGAGTVPLGTGAVAQAKKKVQSRKSRNQAALDMARNARKGK